jgi:hypothetical protein
MGVHNISDYKIEKQIELLEALVYSIKEMSTEDQEEVIRHIFDSLLDLDADDFFGTEGLDKFLGV